MAVKRIVPNIQLDNPQDAKNFYSEIFDLELVMDLGWIVSFASGHATTPQVNVASHGGAGTLMPEISIEVDNVDETYRKACEYGAEICYELTEEEWGIRRFFVRDPSGVILNVTMHL